MSTHRGYHNDLKPGISISSPTEPESACSLGVLFETEAEPGKRFILTVNHGVGDVGVPVIQPGKLDNGTEELRCATVSKYAWHGIDNNRRMLDYAFCEINGRNVENPSNRPLQTGIVITGTRNNVSGVSETIEVQKVGRRTFHTRGHISDRYVRIRNAEFSEKPIYAVKVHGNFGLGGDSGAPVFDEDGQLWGIFQGFKNTTPRSPLPEAVIVPIHLILEHVRAQFGVEFRLI